MKLFIRVDSSNKIGSGHLVRCLNLASKIKSHFDEILFLTKRLPENSNYLLESRNFDVRTSDSEAEIVSFIKENKPDVLIVDSYWHDRSWEDEIIEHTKKLFVIDDLDREHNAHALLDQNYHFQKSDLYLDFKGLKFIGQEYSILSPFFKLSGNCKIRDQVQNITVFFGGNDEHDLTMKVANLASSSENFHWNFIVGKNYKNLKALTRLQASNKNIAVKMNVSDMYTELGGADLFLGSGGTITWERAFCGLPSVVISVAENQVEINKALCNDNIINYLGYCNDVNINQIRAELEKMNSHKELRQQLSKNSLKLKVSSKVDQIIDYLIKDL